MGYTNEFIFSLYGAYAGCDVWNNSFFTICKFEGIKITEGVVWVRNRTKQGTPDESSYEQCKLLLTPPSEISDEHAELVAKHGGHNGRPSFAHAGKELLNEYLLSSSCNVRPIEWFAILDFLRSKGYDMGYGEIPSLIQAGIAIDKTLINQ